MKYSAVAGRYAKALLDVAIGLEKEEEYGLLLEIVARAYDSLKDFFDDPTINPLKKHEKILSLLKGVVSVDKPFENFLRIAFERKRQRYFPLMVALYRDMRIESEGKIPVEVYTPQELSEEEKEILAKFVKKHSLREPVFREHISDGLIAGVRLEFQGMTYDISVKGRLLKMVKGIFGKG